MVLFIFINILKEFLAIDKLGTFDNSVERSHLQYGVLDLLRQEFKDESVKFIRPFKKWYMPTPLHNFQPGIR